MRYDLTFLVLSLCLHLGKTYNLQKQCQVQLTKCYNEEYKKYPKYKTDALVGYCLIHKVDWMKLEK